MTIPADNQTGNNASTFDYKVGVISQSPSEFQIWSIVCLASFMTAMMIVIVVGNMLVLIAIATENNLSNIQNWFIASLAVADMLIGLVIMPFSLSYMLMGYWMFGTLWCEIHGAMDVFLCTSSIMNICLISLDRYWSITRAVEYINSRTPRMVNSLIVTCWALSGIISIPPLMGWKKDVDMDWFWALLSQQGNRTQLEFIRDLEMSGQMDLENFTQTLETVVYPQCGVSLASQPPSLLGVRNFEKVSPYPELFSSKVQLSGSLGLSKFKTSKNKVVLQRTCLLV